LLRPMPA